MVYRRLPNTDNSRLIAIMRLNELLLGENFEVLNNFKDTIVNYKTVFEELIIKRKDFVLKRRLLNERKKIQIGELRLYVSHFLQVFNFAIERGDISKEARFFFGLEIYTGVIPPLSKESDVLKWAKNIIEGEQQRVNNGSVVISYPDFLKLEKIKEIAEGLIEELQKLENSFESYQTEIKKQRINIDAFIKQIWNEIEFQFSNDEIEIKRKKATCFGVVYVK